jgi:hypothetical protein
MSARRDAGWRNPLRRTSDRVEAWSTFLTIMAMLFVAPWAAWSVAGQAFREDVQANAWELRHRFEVTAVLLADAAPPAEIPAGDGSPPGPASAQARWTGPDGVPRTGPVDTEPGRRAGTTQLIWVDERGSPAAAPVRRSPVAHAILCGLLVAGAVAGLLTAVHRIILWRLDRRRMHDWEAQWQVVEPRWSHR